MAPCGGLQTFSLEKQVKLVKTIYEKKKKKKRKFSGNYSKGILKTHIK